MTPIQFILIAGLIILISVFVRGFNRSRFLKPLLVLVSVFGIYLVIFPNTAMMIANNLGVDEAADLMSYIFMIIMSIVAGYLASKVKQIHNMVTKLYREKSIEEAKKYGDTK
jgi:hypothetical protein